MKQRLLQILNNDVFKVLIIGVVMETAFLAVVLSAVRVPSDDILDTNLAEVRTIFDGYDAEAMEQVIAERTRPHTQLASAGVCTRIRIASGSGQIVETAASC